MSEYSARQFADCQADNIRVSDHCADQAGAGELWFVEDGRELIGARGAEELVLYRWNRSYPGDVTFPWPLTGWTLMETADFPGTSHEKITEEVYMITQKGRGYAPAEKTPQEFHGVGKFDPETGLCAAVSSLSFSDVFGQELCRMAASDKTVCAITAAMQHGTGLDQFASEFSSRFFDVGIAEGHAGCRTAGLAK